MNGFFRSYSKKYREDFLYDLENDPYEKNNLVSDTNLEGIRNQLANILKKKMEEVGEEIPIILPKKIKKK